MNNFLNIFLMYQNLIYFLIIIIFLYLCFKQYLNFKKNIFLVKKFTNLETLFSLYTEKAYTVIYKDHILVYSVDGLSPDEKDIEQIQKLYLTLLMNLLGNNLLNIFIDYFGSLEGLFKNAIIYFDEIYENDSIKKSSINQQLNMD